MKLSDLKALTCAGCENETPETLTAELETVVNLVQIYKKTLEKREPWAFRLIMECDSTIRILDWLQDELSELEGGD